MTEPAKDSTPFIVLRVGDMDPVWEFVRESVTQDGSRYDYDSLGHRISMYLDRPSQKEIESFQDAPVRFAVMPYKSVLFLIFRIGDTHIQDAPYSIHRVDKASRVLPDLESARTLHVQMNLVDRSTGRIRAFRVVSWPPEFVRGLHAGIHMQASAPYDAGEYESDLAEAYQIWPDSEVMLNWVEAHTAK
jgi:hypothetical protein